MSSRLFASHLSAGSYGKVGNSTLPFFFLGDTFGDTFLATNGTIPGVNCPGFRPTPSPKSPAQIIKILLTWNACQNDANLSSVAPVVFTSRLR
ncbi:MAG TPA: hypothetical protein DIW81_00665 [Planctomycetaceae bacterium]|nr:hypothetical protein [Rubinisphaera sp.]HCS50096.1 hypothetical protein [Planctomycetaceae bacterium]